MFSTALLYVRTHGEPSSIATAVRQAGAALGPGVPLAETIMLNQEVQYSLWRERLLALLAAFFGAASALLTVNGLYSMLARSVAQRKRELGIRMAIGARTRHIIAAVVSPLAIAITCGITAGFLAAVALLRFTRALLFGVDPVDPVSYAVAAALILVCAGFGAAVPLLRVLSIHPAAVSPLRVIYRAVEQNPCGAGVAT